MKTFYLCCVWRRSSLKRWHSVDRIAFVNSWNKFFAEKPARLVSSILNACKGYPLDSDDDVYARLGVPKNVRPMSSRARYCHSSPGYTFCAEEC